MSRQEKPLTDERIDVLIAMYSRPGYHKAIATALAELKAFRSSRCSSEPISAGSMPNNSSGTDRDAVIEECAVIAENDLHRNTGAIIAKAIRSLKSPPTVG